MSHGSVARLGRPAMTTDPAGNVLSPQGWRCLARLHEGSWKANEWVWPKALRRSCGFRYRHALSARVLLESLHIVWVGNSVQRRTMHALAALLAGTNMSVPSGSEQIADFRKGYHGFQHVRVRKGERAGPFLAEEYCGVPRRLFEVAKLGRGGNEAQDDWRRSEFLGD